MTDNARPTDDVGSLGEEAIRLFAAAADWAREHSGDATGAGEWLSQERIATGAPECRWCPVCQAITLLRSTSPEVKEHLASLVVVARQLLDSAADATAHDTSRERPSTPDVEHIDLSEDDSWD